MSTIINVINAIKLIKEYCYSDMNCDECIFYDTDIIDEYGTSCVLNQGKEPNELDIERIEDRIERYKRILNN